MPNSQVKRYYDKGSTREWNRLVKDAYHRIEFEVTRHFIDKHARPNGKVLDIGGGPGRYAIHLLEQGHNVSLVDLSPQLLKVAKREIKHRRLSSKLDLVSEMNATALTGIPDNSYDTTLLLGPMYHLTDEDSRKKALNEAIRVTKTNGYIFTAIINRLCPFRDILFTEPEVMKRHFVEQYDSHNQLLQSGTLFQSTKSPHGFTDAYFSKLDEIPALYKKAGVKTVETFSCEGIAAFLNEKTEFFATDKVAWSRFIEMIINTSTDPSILGAGEHTVYVGKKRK